jgi:phage terminase small subunit
MKLNARQRVFVQEYLIDKNATRAAKAAGYSPKTARMAGHENLTKPYIRDAIDKAMVKTLQKAQLRAEDVLAEIRKLAFVDLSQAYKDDGTLLHPKAMPDDVRASLQSVETDEIFAGRGPNRTKIGHSRKIKLNDKVRALEMLARHFKLLTDITELTGKDGGPHVVLTMPANGSEVVPEVKPEQPLTREEKVQEILNEIEDESKK